jgi:two-component system response regulator GlrR
LISGPQGGGKEHVARAIHAWSDRADASVVALRAAGTPELLQSRELFGARESAELLLSGDHRGAIESAADGTLLVDRIDCLGASVREALIQALKAGSYHREGETNALSMRAWVIATTENSDTSLLGDLSVQTVEVAPLSERTEDILPLAAHFLGIFAAEEGVKPVGFTADARRCLTDEPWPGNVRELRERVRQAVRLAGDGVISVEALMLAAEGDDVPSFKEAKRGFETRYVKGLLRRCGGNISRAARLAKKDRKDFYDVIRRTGVNPQEFRP